MWSILCCCFVEDWGSASLYQSYVGDVWAVVVMQQGNEVKKKISYVYIYAFYF